MITNTGSLLFNLVMKLKYGIWNKVVVTLGHVLYDLP